MSEVHLPTKGRVANPRDRVMVAQRDGWRIEHDVLSKARGLRFKLTDTRAPALRVAEVGGMEAPERRVWNVVYNPLIEYFGGDTAMLKDYYPAVAYWMEQSIIDYAKASGLTVGKQRGMKAKETA